MPVIESSYRPKPIFRNGDFSTLYSALLRRVKGVHQIRERLELEDGDFLDLNWSFASEKTKKCVILLHGLEGSATRSYILGAAKIFNENGFDACAVNYRGCSGEPNRNYFYYHSGKTDDLETVIAHLIQDNKYSEIVINGFSLGGNIALKYAGENHSVPKEIKVLIAVSVPCDLSGSSSELLKPRNLLYSINFQNTLIQKIKYKQKHFPDKIELARIKSIRNLKEYDDVYTSKTFGFKDAEDYYEKCSCKPFMKNITLPTLMINAKNDSFLSESCYPISEAENNPCIHLEIPEFGGHVGFVDENNVYYTEKRSLEFIRSLQL